MKERQGTLRMKRPKSLGQARWVRALTALGLGVTASLVVATVPAQAGVATRLDVGNLITVPGLVRDLISAGATMANQAEAQDQIDHGARIEISCWGADEFFDDMLPDCPAPGFSGVVSYSGSQLKAGPFGVSLKIINFYEVGGALNEDFGDSDEIYTKARWIDKDGHVLTAQSQQEVGWY
jgi:hypothetical protein